LPALAIAQLPLVDEGEPLPRIPVYLSSSAAILGIGGFGWVAGRGVLGPDGMGFQSIPTEQVVLWTLGLVFVVLMLTWGFFFVRRAAGWSESPILLELLPKSGREKSVFVALSLAAGLGEEIAYRGFLVPALTLVLGWSWGAALLSSAAFGILHAYQGWLGVIRTAALGLILAGSFILSGALWPAILAHAILDIVVGVFFGEILVRG
jgi:membrane protease YdiL (CAAX protease family)